MQNTPCSDFVDVIKVSQHPSQQLLNLRLTHSADLL